MGIPLRRGRFFTRFDREGAASVALVGETMARRFWPDEDPVGKKIKLAFLGETKVREIIGVVGDARHEGLDSDPRTEVFLPHLQEPYGSMTYVVRTASEPAPPDWFASMDKNNDRDLSREEFLGTTEQFKRADADGDGLLSVAEAITLGGGK